MDRKEGDPVIYDVSKSILAYRIYALMFPDKISMETAYEILDIIQTESRKWKKIDQRDGTPS